MSNVNPNSWDNWDWHNDHAEPDLHELLAREQEGQEGKEEEEEEEDADNAETN